MTTPPPTLPDVERPPPYYDDIAACHGELWRRLRDGVGDRRSPFHTPALGTVDPHGRPQVRTVVLRGVDRAAGTLRVHTDRRAEKASEVAAARMASLHVYDRDAKIQVRVEGTATLHTDDAVAEAAWAVAQASSRATYAIDPGPGTAIREGGDYRLGSEAEAWDGAEAGRGNFAVVTVRAERLEFLYLDRRGHRRALWLRSDGGWVESWLVP